MNIEATTAAGTHGLAALLAEPQGALVGFDYDGTLAPIVDDPTRAVPADGAVDALGELSRRVGQVAVVTGRPAQVAVDLGGLARVDGLVVLGLYGLQRWENGAVTGPESLPAVEQAKTRIPDVLATAGHPDAWVEDKGLSVAVHTRRLADPPGAFDDVRPALLALADELALHAEPGRMVVELRPPGMDKGAALAGLADELGASSVTFAGDDLGDVAAFDEVIRRRDVGGAGLLICSGSDEVDALRARADIVVDGPDGVVTLVRALTRSLGSARD